MFKAKMTKTSGESVTIELPQDYSRLSSAVASLGVNLWPEHIPMDGEADNVRGELTSTSEIGGHLMRLFPEGYTLGDANDMAYIVTQANSINPIPIGLFLILNSIIISYQVYPAYIVQNLCHYKVLITQLFIIGYTGILVRPELIE